MLTGTRRALLGAKRLRPAVLYDGTTTRGVINDHANIQDLHGGAFTIDMVLRMDGWGDADKGNIFIKNVGGSSGWIIFNQSGQGLRFICYTDNVFAQTTTGVDDWDPDGRWRRITFQYNDAGDRKPYVWVNGRAVSSYTTQTAAVGTIVSDVGGNLYFGDNLGGNRNIDGAVGWADISNVLRHTNGVSFADNKQLPAIDGNTVLQFLMNEGVGATLDNAEGTAALDCALSNHEWIRAYPYLK